MKKNTKYSPDTGVVVASTILALGCSVLANEQGERELEPTTVLASRFDTPQALTSSAVSKLEGAEISLKQQDRLVDALNDLPGVQGLSTSGQTGNNGSVIVRGLPTRYTQVVVDGVRVTDSTNGINNFLSNGRTGLISSMEFLRGPQSVLYGGEAAGGVLGYETLVGSTAPVSTLYGEVGSYESYRVGLGSVGQLGSLQYGLDFNKSFTANDVYDEFPLQDYSQESAAFALAWGGGDDWLFKLSYQGSASELDTRSLSGGFTLLGEVDIDQHLLAFNTTYEVSDDWSSKLTMGYYDEAYDGSFDGDFGASVYDTDTSRFSANWSNYLKLSRCVTAVAGWDFSSTDYSNSTGRDFDFSTQAVYANTYWEPLEGLLVEGGLRYDDHEEYGGETAWNLGVVYHHEASGTRLRARIAESFRTPTLLNSEAFTGIFNNQIANANLETEKITGYEVGLDQELGDGHQLEVTFFYQNLEDAIRSVTIEDPSPGNGFVGTIQDQNGEGSFRVSGFETAMSGLLCEGAVAYRLSWTAQLKEEVINIPDHNLAADISYQGADWTVGCGVNYLDGASYGAPDNSNFAAVDDRFVTRIYGHYQLSSNVKVHGRVENLFDESYLISDIFGDQIQGQGAAAYAGVTVSF